jgi:hypothetical protein
VNLNTLKRKRKTGELSLLRKVINIQTMQRQLALINLVLDEVTATTPQAQTRVNCLPIIT